MRKRKKVFIKWEKWPFSLIYLPVSVVWVYYIVRSRAVWFFTPSNPTITFGGLEGEPKREMYDQLPDHLYPVTFNVKPGETFDSIVRRMRENGIDLPLVVKPEVGGAGLLFRKIASIGQLREYHSKVPMEFIVQAFVKYQMEVSVFYYRMPNEQRGTISGLLHKVPLHVAGDGKTPLGELIKKHPKAGKKIRELEKVHGMHFHRVLLCGEKYQLSHAANHNKGAQFINLHHEIDDRLLKVFDDLSFQVEGWFYGRYDIMCHSIEQLKQAKNFEILEYNGCGAEPNHIYDSGYTLGQAYREIVRHWKILYQISKYNAENGTPYWSFNRGRKMLSATKKHYRAMRMLEKELSF